MIVLFEKIKVGNNSKNVMQKANMYSFKLNKIFHHGIIRVCKTNTNIDYIKQYNSPFEVISNRLTINIRLLINELLINYRRSLKVTNL